MAVTADITYKGVPLTGIKLEVVSAEHNESTGLSSDKLHYSCQVIMPDDSIQAATGWESLYADPDFTKSPLADAEAQMIARLTAGGATNITPVV